MTLVDIYPLMIANLMGQMIAHKGNRPAQEAISREIAIYESLLNELLHTTFS